jgi:hypothetical protein
VTASTGYYLKHTNTNTIAAIEQFSGTQGGGFSLFNSSGTQNVLFNAGGTSFINGGNVLIGTTTDSGERLVVAGNIRLTNGANRQIYIGSASNYNYRLRTDGDDFVITEAGVTDRLRYSYSTTRWIFSAAATFNSLSGSGNRIVIANSGNTLISAVIGSGLAFDGTTLTATGGSSGSITGSGNSGIIALFTGATSIGNSVITQSSGNVGIGTETPTDFGSTYKVLSINGSSGGGVLDLMVNNTRFLTLAVDGSEPSISGRVSGLPIVFRTNNGGTVGERMRITSGGNVLIGTTSDNGNRLRVNGTIFSDSSVTATSFFESSDATIKTLVEDAYQAKGIDSVVAKLYIKNGKQELGYYAQDLEGVLPSAVSKGSNGLLNLSYREVHTAKIAYLEQRIKQLENELLKPS